MNKKSFEGAKTCDRDFDANIEKVSTPPHYLYMSASLIASSSQYYRSFPCLIT